MQIENMHVPKIRPDSGFSPLLLPAFGSFDMVDASFVSKVAVIPNITILGRFYYDKMSNLAVLLP